MQNNHQDDDNVVPPVQDSIEATKNEDNSNNNTDQTTTDVNNLSQISKLGQQIIQADEASTKTSKSKPKEDSLEQDNLENPIEKAEESQNLQLDGSLPLQTKEVSQTVNYQKHKKRFFNFKSKKSKIILLTTVIILLILASTVGFLFWKSDNAITKRQQANLVDSNIYIGGIAVGGLGANQIKENLQKVIDDQKITLKINDQTVDAKPNDIGINYQIDQTIKNAIKQRRPLLAELSLTKKKQINLPMAVQINNQQLADYINLKVGTQLLSKNAEVVIEDNQLVIKPSAQGAAIDISDLTQQASNIQLNQNLVTINAKTSVTDPPIVTAEAERAKAELDTYIAPIYSIGNPTVGYKEIPFATKLSWLTISPNPDKKTIVVGLDNNKVNQTLDAFIKTFNSDAQERVTVILPSGSSLIAQDGADGISVSADALNAAKTTLSSSITQKQPAKVELATQTVTRGQKTLDGYEKMVLVNKAAYTTQAIQNGQIQKEVVVSTGRPGFETPNGTYSILRKTPIGDMKGCGGGQCWEVKNVKWQSYFTNEGHAIHGTWWYVNYGHQNASHGCVNMHEADAEWFYNWLDIGTPVVVI